MVFLVSVRLKDKVKKFEVEVSANDDKQAEAKLISQLRREYPVERLSYQKAG